MPSRKRVAVARQKEQKDIQRLSSSIGRYKKKSGPGYTNKVKELRTRQLRRKWKLNFEPKVWQSCWENKSDVALRKEKVCSESLIVYDNRLDISSDILSYKDMQEVLSELHLPKIYKLTKVRGTSSSLFPVNTFRVEFYKRRDCMIAMRKLNGLQIRGRVFTAGLGFKAIEKKGCPMDTPDWVDVVFDGVSFWPTVGALKQRLIDHFGPISEFKVGFRPLTCSRFITAKFTTRSGINRIFTNGIPSVFNTALFTRKISGPKEQIYKAPVFCLQIPTWGKDIAKISALLEPHKPPVTITSDDKYFMVAFPEIDKAQEIHDEIVSKFGADSAYLNFADTRKNSVILKRIVGKPLTSIPIGVWQKDIQTELGCHVRFQQTKERVVLTWATPRDMALSLPNLYVSKLFENLTDIVGSFTDEYEFKKDTMNIG